MKTFCLLVTVVLTLSSCLETVIDLELPPHEPKLVVNSSNFVGQHFKVYVSHSLDPLSTSNFEFYSDATVTLFENGLVIDTLEFIDTSSFYQSNVMVEETKTYALQVNHPNYPVLNTKQISSPMTANIKSATHFGTPISGGSNSYIEFQFDDSSEPNYYMLKLKAFSSYEGELGEIITDSYAIGFSSSDPSLENGTLGFEDDFENFKVLFDDQLFNGQTKSIELTYENFFSEYEDDYKIDSIKLVFSTIDYDFFNYHSSRILQNNTEGGAIFGTEPVNVYNSFMKADGTISAYGLFSVNSKDTYLIIP